MIEIGGVEINSKKYDLRQRQPGGESMVKLFEIKSVNSEIPLPQFTGSEGFKSIDLDSHQLSSRSISISSRDKDITETLKSGPICDDSLTAQSLSEIAKASLVCSDNTSPFAQGKE
jgi:hypothetical protein